MPQSLGQNFHHMRRKIGRLLHAEMEAPLINFGQATRLHRDNCRSAWTGIDQGHFADQRSRGLRSLPTSRPRARRLSPRVGRTCNHRDRLRGKAFRLWRAQLHRCRGGTIRRDALDLRLRVLMFLLQVTNRRAIALLPVSFPLSRFSSHRHKAHRRDGALSQLTVFFFKQVQILVPERPDWDNHSAAFP